jgi:hypothetical protein
MPSKTDPPSALVALLSTASIAETGTTAAASTFAEIAGRPMLEWQMLALRQADVRRFLIEVDSVPGALLDLADMFRHDGMEVEFVRTIKDVQDLLPAQTSLVILAEAHHFAPSFVGEMMVTKAPFIATLDSREENAAFERIDLNTRWAGFAKLQSAMVQSIGELPEGWSIGSSLLRHAVQNGVPFVPIAQSRLQQADVMRMDSQADAAALADNILSARANSASGFVERRIFGPIGKYIAPLIWRNSSAHPLIRASAPTFALASLGFSMMSWAVPATTLALIAMIFDGLSDIIFGDKQHSNASYWQKRIFWLVIIMSFLAAAWQTAALPANTIWFASVVVALAWYSSKAALPSWSAALLKSPALLAIGLLITGIFSTLELGAKVIVLAQLVLLIAGQHLPRENTKNSIHA